MNLPDTARAAFLAIQTAHPSGVVAVVSGSTSANGFKGPTNTAAGLTDYGEEGPTTGTFRMDANLMDEPARGATITVDGEEVTVLNTRMDPLGALWSCEHTLRHPVEGL